MRTSPLKESHSTIQTTIADKSIVKWWMAIYDYADDTLSNHVNNSWYNVDSGYAKYQGETMLAVCVIIAVQAI